MVFGSQENGVESSEEEHWIYNSASATKLLWSKNILNRLLERNQKVLVTQKLCVQSHACLFIHILIH